MLFEIWLIGPSYSYPLTKIIDILSHRWTRDQVRSTDKQKILNNAEYLNFISNEDERYEVREIEKDQD